MSQYARHGLMLASDRKPGSQGPGERCVLHMDMDAYFASIEQRDVPFYRGKPLIVCHTASDFRSYGIVATSSYEARAWGVKTGMTVWEARSRCPRGIYVHADIPKYIYNTRRIVEICHDYSPLAEAFSIDEVFLDVTGPALATGGAEGKWEAALGLGAGLKRDIRGKLGLTVSVGIGPNRMVAKMAAELEKPDGLTLVTPDQLPGRFAALPVDKIVGVGRRMRRNFDSMGISTVGELAATPPEVLRRRFGIVGELLHQASLGIDQGRVGRPEEDDNIRSFGHTLSLRGGTRDLERMRNILLGLCDAVTRRMRRAGYLGRTVNLRVRIGYAMGYSRAETMEDYTDLPRKIFRTACRLLEREAMLAIWEEPVTLVGVSVSNVKRTAERQLSLKDRMDPRETDLMEALDSLKDKYGDGVVMRASLKESFELSGMNLIR